MQQARKAPLFSSYTGQGNSLRSLPFGTLVWESGRSWERCFLANLAGHASCMSAGSGASVQPVARLLQHFPRWTCHVVVSRKLTGAGTGASVHLTRPSCCAGQTLTSQDLDKFLQPLVRRLFRYSSHPPTTPRTVQGHFKTTLIDAYRARKNACIYNGERYGVLRCMLSGFHLPQAVVIAGHLFKYAWAEFAEAWMGFKDINDERNGMLLFKPIEYAFDHGQLCFIPNQQGRLACCLLDPALRNTGLLAFLKQMENQAGPHGYTWAEWADWGPVQTAVGNKTFGWLEGRWVGTAGLHVQPFKRCCWFQASMAADEAVRRWGVEVNVPDFYSDEFPIDSATKASLWLMSQS